MSEHLSFSSYFYHINHNLKKILFSNLSLWILVGMVLLTFRVSWTGWISFLVLACRDRIIRCALLLLFTCLLTAKGVGDVAVLLRDGRYVYYLITKPQYFNKPTYDTLQSSLSVMKSHCVKNNVTSLSMPKIGCGLDQLQWPKVESILREVFQDMDIVITIYSFWQMIVLTSPVCYCKLTMMVCQYNFLSTKVVLA